MSRPISLKAIKALLESEERSLRGRIGSGHTLVQTKALDTLRKSYERVMRERANRLRRRRAVWGR